MPRSEQNPVMEDILGIADTLEINNANVTNNIVVRKKTNKNTVLHFRENP